MYLKFHRISKPQGLFLRSLAVPAPGCDEVCVRLGLRSAAVGASAAAPAAAAPAAAAAAGARLDDDGVAPPWASMAGSGGSSINLRRIVHYQKQKMS